MKTYVVHYTETLVHTFYVEANNEEEAKEEFEYELQEGKVDFSDGEVSEANYTIEEGDDRYHYHYAGKDKN